MTFPALTAGVVVWADLGVTTGREQAGRRPCLVVSSTAMHRAADTMTIIVPCTSRMRPWENHVQLEGATGLSVPTFAVTEQVRTISTQRIAGAAGTVSQACLNEVLQWVQTWLAKAA